jgi:hypothetical protein
MKLLEYRNLLARLEKLLELKSFVNDKLRYIIIRIVLLVENST